MHERLIRRPSDVDWRRLHQRAFPRGPVDLLWQCAIIVIAYHAWRYTRGAVDGSAADSFRHAYDLVAVERSLHTLIEADVQSWATSWAWPADFARWMYSNAHFRGSLFALLFIYFVHNRSFYFVRNMLIIAMGISLLGYAFYPTAPPRFIPGLGFDASTAVTGNSAGQVGTDPLHNPYAAVPSMHIGLAMIFGWSLALLVRKRPLKLLLYAYPLLITFVVVATGNHWWLDALLGAGTAVIAAGAAMLIARFRPELWSFRPAAERVREPIAEPLPEGAAA